MQPLLINFWYLPLVMKARLDAVILIALKSPSVGLEEQYTSPLFSIKE